MEISKRQLKSEIKQCCQGVFELPTKPKPTGKFNKSENYSLVSHNFSLFPTILQLVCFSFPWFQTLPLRRFNLNSLTRLNPQTWQRCNRLSWLEISDWRRQDREKTVKLHSTLNRFLNVITTNKTADANSTRSRLSLQQFNRWSKKIKRVEGRWAWKTLERFGKILFLGSVANFVFRSVAKLIEIANRRCQRQADVHAVPIWLRVQKYWVSAASVIGSSWSIFRFLVSGSGGGSSGSLRLRRGGLGLFQNNFLFGCSRTASYRG